MKGFIMEGKNVAEAVTSVLHPKTVKDIETLGAEETLRRRKVQIMVFRRTASPLVPGLQKEADLIAEKYNIETGEAQKE